MRDTTYRNFWIGTSVLATVLLGACGRHDSDSAPGGPRTGVDTTAQSVVPPPAGDSTPKAADSTTRQAVEGSNEKSGAGGTGQSTVGTAASGAPPYSLNGAPEGNAAPEKGDRSKK